jgi:hypothetical protein
MKALTEQQKQNQQNARRGIWKHIGENYLSVIPIVLVVTVLYFVHIDDQFTTPFFVAFLMCAAVIGLGLSLFTAGADLSMTRIGTIVGGTLFKQRKMWLIVLMTFIIGVLVTVAEPDLKVMASQIGWDETQLIIFVGVGVGLFVVFGVIRIVFNQNLNVMFLAFYALVFALAGLMSEDGKGLFLPIAFDSGGVTTGPVTVPFILAFGAGLAASKNTNGRSGEDAFGLTALASVGPIITVMIMSLFLPVNELSYKWDVSALVGVTDWGVFWNVIVQSGSQIILNELLNVMIAILPLAVFFLIYNWLFVRMSWKQVVGIFVGLIYAYLGLVVFLSAVNLGFLPVAQELGFSLGAAGHPEFFPVAVLIGGLFGLFGVLAEPAVHVLVQQIETLSEGTIKSRQVLLVMALSIGGGVALAIVRAHFGFSILWYMVPGYVIALALTFVVPKIYTSIAFDSGGVASGPMASTFVMPFAIGFTYAAGYANAKAAGMDMTYGSGAASDVFASSATQSYMSNYVFQNAFGCVSMIAMMPLIVIQLMGLYAEIKRAIILKKVQEKFIEPDDLQVIHFAEASK